MNIQRNNIGGSCCNENQNAIAADLKIKNFVLLLKMQNNFIEAVYLKKLPRKAEDVIHFLRMTYNFTLHIHKSVSFLRLLVLPSH